MDTLGTGLLSFVERLSLSQRSALSNSLLDRTMFSYPRPQASLSGYTVRVCLFPDHTMFGRRTAATNGNSAHIFSHFTMIAISKLLGAMKEPQEAQECQESGRVTSILD